MTAFSDQLAQGAASYAAFAQWNGGGMSGLPVATSAPWDTQTLGVPHSQTFAYQIGTASTALASGVFFSATGTATTGTSTLTATGALAAGGVATFDVPRGLRITASVNLSTTTFTFVGTEGYGQDQTYSMTGPTGDTFGNAGSYVDSLVTFKTITAISLTAAATGIATTALAIGDNNCFGLPYRIDNVGMGIGVFINGSSATVPATWAAGFTATGTTTATTADVRGTVTLATVVLANDSRYITVCMIQPPVNLTPSTDDKVHSYGAAPYTT